MLNNIVHLFNWFIPDDFKEKPEKYYRAKIFVALAFVSIIFTSLTAVVNLTSGYIGFDFPVAYHYLLILFIISIVSVLFLFKWSSNLTIAVNVWMFVSFLNILFYIPYTGGFYSTSIYWMSLVPLFGFLLGGIRLGVTWIAGVVLVLVGLYYLTNLGYIDLASSVTDIKVSDAFWGAISFICFTAALIYTTIRYQNVLAEELEKGRGVLELQKSQLEQQAIELMRTKEALERYAYVTSHDLKQPLKTIEGLSQVLGRHLNKKGQLDTQTIELMAYINKSVQNMDHLITDLLDVSRKNHLQQQIQACDLNDLLDNVLHNLSNAIQKEGVVIQKEELPKLSVIPIQITQVFQNLISNAIKFRDPQRPLKIQVSAHELERCWEFSIKDNGKGIKKQYLQSIFEPFNKLDETAQGSGIGLDTCSKIIEEHGGKIWADSEFGTSTTFYFTIEKNIIGATLVVDRDVVEADPYVCPDGEEQPKA